MASYKGHLIGGAVAAAAYTGVMLFVPVEQFAEHAQLLSDQEAIIGVFVIAMLFSLFPDVDTKSKGQLLFFWAVFVLDAFLIWTKHLEAAAYLGIIAILPLLGHHRGLTHHKLAAFIVPLPIVLVPYLFDAKMLAISLVYYGGGVVGYLSHLLLDGMLVRWFRIRSRRYE
jgi:membrane-bound metal-dependent hydrolase YbcI (DUF457 family)